MNRAPGEPARALGPGALPGIGAAAIAGAVFVFAFGVRAANAHLVLASGVPQIAPFDELYHAKRIVHSALHPGTVLDFDPDRGAHGAFCPWPPLYDLAAGGAARALGARAPVDVLRRAVWFPPLVASAGAAVLAGIVAGRRGWPAGLLAGLALAFSTPFLDGSRVGSIDHHFLEPLLVLGILGALDAVGSARAHPVVAAAVLGVAVSVALLVQPALLLAAALACIAVLLLPPERVAGRLAAAAGFALAAANVFLYAATSPPGRPPDEWFLGTAHGAALLAAAAACAADAWLLARGARRLPAAAFGAGIGALTLAAVPTAASSLLSGSRFFGGDPWLDRISEFGPLFFRPDSMLAGDLALLGGGAWLLAGAVLLDRRWRAGFRATLAAFALTYAVAAVRTNRFLIVAAALLAVAGALVVADLLASRARRMLVAGAAAVLLVPSLLLAAGRVRQPSPQVPPYAVPWLRAAAALRSHPIPGRVLAPWSWGHLFDVVGGRPVLVDNFGAAIGRTEFDDALGILLSPSAGAVAGFLERSGARFLVLDDPRAGMALRAAEAGFPAADYPAEGPPTPLMRGSFWWRAYFAQGEAPRIGAFRRIAVIPEREGVAPEARGAVQIWELEGSASPGNDSGRSTAR